LIESVAEMQDWAWQQRRHGRAIGFVPTMGYLHEGHVSLMRLARERADQVVASIFVNPMQFGPKEDLAAYPRDLERDKALCEAAGVDVIFHPSVEEIYPAGYQTQITVPAVAAPLCGASRPEHFGGVATVCCKLFNCVQPNFAVFGAKDFQQLMVVTRMVADLNLPVEIVAGPTVREADGLAMSSRNVYLTASERAEAPIIQRTLAEARALVAAGETRRDTVLALVRERLAGASLGRVDYVDLRKIPNLEAADEFPTGRHLLAVAVFFGRARLIDNQVLDFAITD